MASCLLFWFGLLYCFAHVSGDAMLAWGFSTRKGGEANGFMKARYGRPPRQRREETQSQGREVEVHVRGGYASLFGEVCAVQVSLLDTLLIFGVGGRSAGGTGERDQRGAEEGVKVGGMEGRVREAFADKLVGACSCGICGGLRM
jgi:hypothetical protein